MSTSAHISRKRVAIILWYLGTQMEYWSIGHLFGVAHCTAFVIVHETCTAIIDVLLKAYISFPKGDKVKQVVDGFQRTWGVPQCCGAIDGCHIPISAPAMNHTDYYNRKGFYSVVTQAVVNYQYRFLDVYTGQCAWCTCVCTFLLVQTRCKQQATSRYQTVNWRHRSATVSHWRLCLSYAYMTNKIISS